MAQLEAAGLLDDKAMESSSQEMLPVHFLRLIPRYPDGRLPLGPAPMKSESRKYVHLLDRAMRADELTRRPADPPQQERRYPRRESQPRKRVRSLSNPDSLTKKQRRQFQRYMPLWDRTVEEVPRAFDPFVPQGANNAQPGPSGLQALQAEELKTGIPEPPAGTDPNSTTKGGKSKKSKDKNKDDQ